MGGFAIHRIMDENYYDLIINKGFAASYNPQEHVTPINLRDSLVNIPAIEPNACDLGRHPYNFFPSLFCLTSRLDLEGTGIGRVQRNPNLAFFGQGVLIGVLDTGIDYQHKAFLNADGTSRILSIWDQTIQEGVPPEGFFYGTEYKKEQIDLALKSDAPFSIVPSRDENGHGTAIASVIAGSSDDENAFTGIVPASNLIVVKLKEAKRVLRQLHFVPEGPVCYQESDVLFAARYLFDTARSLRMPLALCIAFGTSQGGHDGNGSTSAYLSYISQLSQTGVTISAGNEGNTQRHYFGTTDPDTYQNEFNLRAGIEDRKFAFEIWPYSPSRLTLEIITPGGESTREIFPSLSECRRFSFIYDASIVYVNNILSEQEIGGQVILVRMENPTEGNWRLRVRNIENATSSFHVWLPAGDFISKESYFFNSSPNTTVLSPGNSTKPMTVTAFNQRDGSILPESSRGYTRTTAAVIPELAAPGYQLTCAVPGGGYGNISGSGAASAYASGIVAMIFEWAVVRGNYVTMSGNDIKYLLIQGADREVGTVYPNNIWGYGKINVDGFFRTLLLT